LRGFGLKVGKTRRTASRRIKELVEEHPTLRIIATSLLAVHAALLREFKVFEKQIRIMGAR